MQHFRSAARRRAAVLLRTGFVLAFVFLVLSGVSAQFDPRQPCQRYPNPTWKTLTDVPVGGVIEASLDHGNWDLDLAASSVLPAEGAPPVAPESDDPEVRYEYSERYAAWSCMYGPHRAVDGDTSTAWSEGAPGNGEGEVLVVPLAFVGDAEIWTGFGRSRRLHGRNGRPRRVRVHLLQGLTGMAHQYDTRYGHFLKLAEGEAELADKNGWQSLPVPKAAVVTDRSEIAAHLAPFFESVPEYIFLPAALQPALFLAIEILSVYPGSAYEDTLISEVRQPVG